ncbi:Sm-like protein lsm7 [Tulasnella sp. 403]|nr:Sm-like protein lsm7 [Tulasnella sp. 403]
MADRGRGSGRGAPRGRGRGGGGSGPTLGPNAEKPKREAILDLGKYVEQRIRVKFTGGREGELFFSDEEHSRTQGSFVLVTGVLKGYDQLLNLVLDEVEENLQEGGTRPIGLAVLRGPQITILSPVDGSEEIENPFASDD